MVELSADEANLLLRLTDVPESLRQRLGSHRDQVVTLDEEDASLLLEAVTDRLMTHGFDPNYKATPEGAQLEQLIDRLNTP